MTAATAGAFWLAGSGSWESPVAGVYGALNNAGGGFAGGAHRFQVTTAVEVTAVEVWVRENAEFPNEEVRVGLADDTLSAATETSTVPWLGGSTNYGSALQGTFPAAFDWVEFALPAPVTLTTGIVYCCVLTFVSTPMTASVDTDQLNDGNEAGWIYDNTSGLALVPRMRGRQVNNPSYFADSSTEPFPFKLYGDEAELTGWQVGSVAF